MSKITDAAKAAFEADPTLGEVYVTEDGNAFRVEVQNLAIDHARRSGLPAPVLVQRDKEGTPEEKAAPEKAAPEEAVPEEAAPEEAAPKGKKKGK